MNGGGAGDRIDVPLDPELLDAVPAPDEVVVVDIVFPAMAGQIQQIEIKERSGVKLCAVSTFASVLIPLRAHAQTVTPLSHLMSSFYSSKLLP